MTETFHALMLGGVVAMFAMYGLFLAGLVKLYRKWPDVPKSEWKVLCILLAGVLGACVFSVVAGDIKFLISA